MKNKFLTIINLAIVLSVGIITATQATCPNDQTCGENCCWNLTDGVLSISGTGDMDNFESGVDAPWYDQKDSITSIDISNGITSIGNYSFQDLNAITSLNIPDSVTIIGRGAFLYMTVENATLTIPNSVTSIGAGAFKGMGGVASLTIPNSVTSIGGGTFMNMNGIVDITIPDTTELHIGIYSPFEGIDLSQVTFHCAGVLEQCKANMLAIGLEEDTYTMLQAPYSKKQADGSRAYYDANGKLTGFTEKRIYTVEEARQAVEAAGTDTVNVRIRYK